MTGKTSPTVLALLLSCGTAQAAEWFSLGKSVAGDETFVDVSSVRVAGPMRRAWFKTIYVPHKTKESTGPDANKWWHEGLQRKAFNCAEETARSEALTVYYEDGTNGSDPPAAYPTRWEPVVPETVLNTEMQFICAWKSKIK
jgi:hypothetical protein